MIRLVVCVCKTSVSIVILYGCFVLLTVAQCGCVVIAVSCFKFCTLDYLIGSKLNFCP